MPGIAVGGFLHETNTFAPTKATYADFVHGGGWPSAPGAMPADAAALPWTRLRPGIRLKPNGPAFVAPDKTSSHSPAIG